ncbi:MAG: malonate transporter subunit MadL [Planctomycetaceae bacterium]|nr:malonate transporter subunit MadL [Planctomycetaceae bacterium]
MAIYGTALLSFCLVSGLIIGRLLGVVLGVDANIGGVGIAMLLLIGISGKLRQTGHLPTPTQGGVLFWSSMYIPIVVAMAASQNVRAALTGGPAAIVAGTLVVAVSFALVPLIHHLGRSNSVQDSDEEVSLTQGDDE